MLLYAFVFIVLYFLCYYFQTSAQNSTYSCTRMVHPRGRFLEHHNEAVCAGDVVYVGSECGNDTRAEIIFQELTCVLSSNIRCISFKGPHWLICEPARCHSLGTSH